MSVLYFFAILLWLSADDEAIVIETGERIEVYKLDGITLIVYPIAN